MLVLYREVAKVHSGTILDIKAKQSKNLLFFFKYNLEFWDGLYDRENKNITKAKFRIMQSCEYFVQ